MPMSGSLAKRCDDFRKTLSGKCVSANNKLAHECYWVIHESIRVQAMSAFIEQSVCFNYCVR